MFLAVSTLVAIRMDPTELGHSWAAYGLFVFYLANGILILMLLRRRQQSTAGFPVSGACRGCCLAGCDFNFCGGAANSVFPFLLLRLGGGGVSVGTCGKRWARRPPKSCCCGLKASLFSTSGRRRSLPWRALLGLHVNVKEFEPEPLFMLSVYLLVMGLLLGYLAEQQKHLRAEKAVITGILSRSARGSGTDRNDPADLPRS